MAKASPDMTGAPENALSAGLRASLLGFGADLVGFGGLGELPAKVREGLPVGVVVAVKIPPDIVRGISELPTMEYCQFYRRANALLDQIVARGAEYLIGLGFQAVAQTREKVGFGEKEDRTLLPHKTVATRAGLGWIGKCALLVTEEHGSAVRLSSILTDAPLTLGAPVNVSRCAGCSVCRDACPAKAVSGKSWSPELRREDFFDATLCRRTAEERSFLGFGGGDTICGKCVEVCPRTRRAMKGAV